jgi:hypothetical protein
MATSFLAALSRAVQADPLTTFTLTDLGTGTPTFASEANGGVVIAGNGQMVYPFQLAQDTRLDPQQLLSSHIPMLDPAPVNDPNTYHDPIRAYSTPLSAFTNGQGTYVAIDAYGVYGHRGSADVYSVKRNPDGTWGNPTAMWSGGDQFDGLPSPALASITGINKLNEVLGMGSGGGFSWPQTYLYELNSRTLLNLGDLNVLQSGGWNNLRPIAIDDQGRILLQASLNPVMGDRHQHTLLLTPEGVSSDPLAVPAPEPGPLALAVLTITAQALRRAARAFRQARSGEVDPPSAL